MKAKLHYAIILCLAFTTIGFSQVDLGDDIIACQGESFVLDASTANATSYQWVKDGQILGGETSATLLVTESGLYEATVIVSGTPISDTIVVTINSNPSVSYITPYNIQNLSSNGFETFDLTTKIPEITNGNTDLIVTFYETQVDAQTNTNPIINPTNYQNIANPTTIFLRVEDINTGCSRIRSFTLEVLTHVIVECTDAPGITTYCYGNDDATEFFITAEDSSSILQLTFLAGEVENSWDELLIYDSDGVTLLYLGYGNNGDLTGLSFEATGNNLTIKISSDGVNSCQTNSYEPWQFTATCSNSPTFGTLEVRSFLDENNNSVFDDGEILFPNGSVEYEVNDNGIINEAAANGNNILINSDQNDTYDFTFILYEAYEDCFDVTIPTIDNVSIVQGETTTIDFPITEQQLCEDVGVTLANYSAPPRPGFTHSNTLYLKNYTATTLNMGTVEVTIDDLLVLGTVVSNDTNHIVTNTATGFTINFTNLQPFEVRDFSIELSCPASIPLDEIVVNTATYIADANDLVSENNMSTLQETVVNSWDPNDITESRGPEIIHPDFTSEDYLYYTIRFQNLGTAEAINVRIEETLDTQVDETTFQMIASSHAYQVRRINDELVWNFDNINLPAEMFDAEGSNGFVHFKIKPKAGYAIGDIIPGVAGIYFDFNAPVITNIFETEFVEPLSVDELSSTQIKMYPNPVKDILYIKLDKSELINIQLIDIHGKQILTKTATDKQIELNVSSLKSGIYFLKLSSDTAQLTKKIIVN
ncbi:T9SS type A sorting domain-containing protein [Kordia sp.]|uniref:T9SS type A sorting domain-containing protein n=1 Tax=Kordia sp. TaxID=1965332 RepID=UPI003D6B92DB